MKSSPSVPRIFHSHLLSKQRSFLSNILVDLQFSQPYVKTEIVFELKILSFVLVLCIFDFHTLLSVKNAVDAFTILVDPFLTSPLTSRCCPGR